MSNRHDAHDARSGYQCSCKLVATPGVDEGIDIRFLLHDHDTKFTAGFNEHFDREDGGPILTPIAAPMANCYIESWIGSMKRECLNHFFCFALGQLDHIAQTYAMYHNEYRPHQGMDNRPPASREDPPAAMNKPVPLHITRRTWLGGLLSHYDRWAA